MQFINTTEFKDLPHPVSPVFVSFSLGWFWLVSLLCSISSLWSLSTRLVSLLSHGVALWRLSPVLLIDLAMNGK